MLKDCRDRVSLVVGGASGMGRLAAQRWADAGGVVAVADVDQQGMRRTATGYESIVSWCVDVADHRQVALLVEEVESELGPIERVYNAAAIQPTQLLLKQDLEEIHRVMHNNYGGVVNVSLATLPLMVARGRGALVNFGSIAGWVPNMHFGAYCASKSAVAAFSEVLYHENRKKGVHICCVCPSKVDTPLIKQATSKPKMLEIGPRAMTPGFVLDAIDRAVEKKRFWVFPGAHTVMGWRLRRFFPGLLWKIGHHTEGF